MSRKGEKLKTPGAKLTWKQMAFAKNFVRAGFNATEAAVMTAGTDTYLNRKAAAAVGHKWLDKAEVRAEIMRSLPANDIDPQLLAKWLRFHIENSAPRYSLQAVKLAYELLDGFPDKIQRSVASQLKIEVQAGEPAALPNSVRRLLLEGQAIPEAENGEKTVKELYDQDENGKGETK